MPTNIILQEPPHEGVRHLEPNTKLYIEAENVGNGTLYVTESYLVWLNDSGDGFKLRYPNIPLNALSPASDKCPERCILLLLDVYSDDDDDIVNSEVDEIEKVLKHPVNTDNDTIEIRFVPSIEDNLQHIYQAINICSSMNPGPEAAENGFQYDESDGEDEFQYEDVPE